MGISRSNVDRIVISVFDTLFGEEPRDRQDGLLPIREVVRARIKMAGAWQGEILLEVPSDLAKDLAAAFLEQASADVTRAQVLDTVGEMANMIAGNLRPLMPGSRMASMPRVDEEILAGNRVSPASGTLQREYSLDGRSLRVELINAPNA